MSGIGGSKREEVDYSKKVGLFEGKVIAINPTVEQYKELLNIEVKEDSKAADYLGESKEGNTTLRIDVWLQELKTGGRFKTSFFLEDKIKSNKEATKNQYINEIGVCSWAEDKNDLPEWFAKRDFRKSNVGEEELYNFLRIWLGKLDYRSESTVLQVDWKKLMKGNVKDLKDQIDGEYAVNVGCLATIVTRDRDGKIEEYQNIYNKAFLSAYTLKNFNLIDYGSEEVLDKLNAKKTADLKPHERFVLQVTGDYGCKDFYVLKPLKDYNPEENIAASDAPMTNDKNSDY